MQTRTYGESLRIGSSRLLWAGCLMHLVLGWAMTRFPSSSHELYQMVNEEFANKDWQAIVVFSGLTLLVVSVWACVLRITWLLTKSSENGLCDVGEKKISGCEQKRVGEGIGAYFGVFHSSWKVGNACKIESALPRGHKLTEHRTKSNYCVERAGLEKCLLPLRKVGAAEDVLTVVLDLDDTLIMTRKSEHIPGNVAESIRKKLLSTKQTVWDYGQGDSSITIVFRPGVQKFIRELAKFAEVVIFTAASKPYADPLIDELDPDHTLFSARLFRCSTVKTRYQEYVKDLSLLGRSLSRVVLVDDKPLSGLLQPHNVLPCAPFTGDYRDHQLMVSYLPLLEHLQSVPDVRPVLSSIFEMENYLMQWGVQEKFLKKCLDSPGDTRHSRLR